MFQTLVKNSQRINIGRKVVAIIVSVARTMNLSKESNNVVYDNVFCILEKKPEKCLQKKNTRQSE